MLSNLKCAATIAALVAALLAVYTQLAAVDVDASPNLTSAGGCNALSNAGLRALLLYPGDTAYTQREAAYWATNAPLGPQCIVQPRNTGEVSHVVKALVDSRSKFAIRSGGHMQNPGANDIRDGVTVDLGLMTNVTYDPDTTIASIQPGLRWRDVYAALAVHDVVCTGGRDGNVGVAGFLTGGGNSYHTGRTGFGIDTVVNYEIVLASGEVVNANKSSNPDLWRALKGGSGSNFGIVTRFDVETLPRAPLWGGMAVHDKAVSDQLATTLVNFNENNYKNPQDAYILLSTYNSVLPSDTVIASVIIDTEGTVNASAFSEILQVPAIQMDRKTRSLEEVTVSYQSPGGARMVLFTLTTNNDVEIVKYIWQSHDQVVEEFKASLGGSFSTQCVVQPLPAYFADISVKNGGNVLGLDSVKTDSILWLGTVAYQNPADDQLVHGKMQNWTTNIQSFAKSREGGTVQWLYVNYADASQSPLGSYGKANVDFLKTVAKKYDPTGVLQLLVPGGFKISKT